MYFFYKKLIIKQGKAERPGFMLNIFNCVMTKRVH